MKDRFIMNIKQQYEKAIQWKTDAVADGWLIKPTYKIEPVESAATLERENFVAQIYTRYKESKPKEYQYDGSVSVWGPDRLAIDVQHPYSWKQLNDELRYCHSCNSKDVDTVRISFAGRCCKKCLPELRKTHEPSGWYD